METGCSARWTPRSDPPLPLVWPYTRQKYHCLAFKQLSKRLWNRQTVDIELTDSVNKNFKDMPLLPAHLLNMQQASNLASDVITALRKACYTMAIKRDDRWIFLKLRNADAVNRQRIWQLTGKASLLCLCAWSQHKHLSWFKPLKVDRELPYSPAAVERSPFFFLYSNPRSVNCAFYFIADENQGRTEYRS